MVEIDLVQWMRDEEKKMSSWWKIKMMPYKIEAELRWKIMLIEDWFERTINKFKEK